MKLQDLEKAVRNAVQAQPERPLFALATTGYLTGEFTDAAQSIALRSRGEGLGQRLLTKVAEAWS